jgi:hypothetical protein
MKQIVTFALLVLGFLSAQAQQTNPDVLYFRQVTPEICCFDLLLENVHEPKSSLNFLRLRILTPDVRFQPGVGGPWPVKAQSDTSVLFGDQALDLVSGEAVDGFHVCFHFRPGLPREVLLEWTSEYNGVIVTRDTISLNCEVPTRRCDSVAVASVTIPGQPEGSCCYEFSITNVHEPAGELNGFRLVVQNPGAMITGLPSGPWDIVEQSSTSISFEGLHSPLNPGEELRGFRICVTTPQGAPGDLTIRWISSFNGQIVCESDIIVNCVPVFTPRRDTLLVIPRQDCSYNIGFINTHVPKSTLSGFRLSVITPGASIQTVSAPTGWAISTQSALNVHFNKSGAALASGDSAKGFLVTFKPSSSGLVRFTGSTFNGTTLVTRDTARVQCTPPPPVICDSLLVTKRGPSCEYDFGFVNKHQPASGINEFHLRLQSPGATISDAVVPAGWEIQSRTPTVIVFRDTTGVIATGQQQTGFLLTLTPSDVGNTVIFEYCTALDGSLNCCDFATVECTQEQETCDSLEITASSDYCSYEVSLRNVRIPSSGLDAWRLTLNNPDAVLQSAEAPSGWTLDTLDDRMLRFVKNEGELAYGETASGFVIRFVPSRNSSQIPFTWCTELTGQDRCCDTASVACEVKIVQCDVVDVLTSTERPCCFDFSVQNTHLPRGIINGFNVQILTPGVTLFTSTIQSPDGWTQISNSTRVGWRRTDGAILPGETLEGFSVCYDNSATGNADFEILTQTVENGLIICEDTLTIKCDRTLAVELLPGSRPGSFRLHQNFPNPFNPVTTIMFDLPQRSDVILSLFDTHGRLVMDLASGEYEAGSWQITLDASALTSGTYHYQLRTPDYSETRSLILLK